MALVVDAFTGTAITTTTRTFNLRRQEEWFTIPTKHPLHLIPTKVHQPQRNKYRRRRPPTLHQKNGDDDDDVSLGEIGLDDLEHGSDITQASNNQQHKQDSASLSPDMNYTWSTSSKSTPPTSPLDTVLENHNEAHIQEEQQKQNQALWLLNAVGIIWGTQHAVIKTVVANSAAAVSASGGMLSDLEAEATAFLETTTTSFSTTTATMGTGEMILGDTLTAAVFTLLRFSLAALAACPYTPGLDQIIWQNWKTTTTTQTTTTTALPLSSFGSVKHRDINAELDHNNGVLSSFSSQDDTEDSVINAPTEAAIAATATATTLERTTAIWRWGAELGVWMFLGFAFQAIGLQYTTAQKSGFLLYLNCKFVPLFAALLFGKSISWPTWMSALLAVVGTALLAIGGGGGGSSDVISGSANDWNVGDLWSIAAAMTSAMFILRMERASESVAENAASQLNAACLWIVTILAAAWTMAAAAATAADGTIAAEDAAEGMTATMARTVTASATSTATVVRMMTSMVQESWLAFLYLGGIATALGNWLQTKAQRYVSAERACVIYAMDPVYGAVFSAWWLGESLPGTSGYIGAGLITIAAATNALLLENNTNANNSTSNNVQNDYYSKNKEYNGEGGNPHDSKLHSK
ncbi:hypothetical protein ACA910_008085 [Epithemia clementina (nom. ined.)]